MLAACTRAPVRATGERAAAPAPAAAPAGRADALPYFAVFEPAASAAGGGAPRGVMIVIHGGGWQSDGERSVHEARNLALVERWRARGWRVFAISYRSSSEGPSDLWPFFIIGDVRPVVPGSRDASLEDVLLLHDRIREQQGDEVPVCAIGPSAGGHLALLLAAHRPDSVDCVVALAAPTDLPPLVAAGTDAGRAAAFAFGPEAAATPGSGLSPVDVAGSIRAPILLATAENDRWVPIAQMEAMREALAASGSPALLSTIALAPGRQVFWHGRVSDAALADYLAAEEAFAEAAAERGLAPVR